MASKEQDFSQSGPSHLTCINWENAYHRRSVAASLVQGVYTLERDREDRRENTDRAQASPWWEFFHFKLHTKLNDDADSSIFGAVFEYKPQVPSHPNCPQYVIAFRGTLHKLYCINRDLELDFEVIRNGLHKTSRYEIAMRAIRSIVAAAGEAKVWLAGHSLGAALTMLTGKTLAKNGVVLESFLFNPPFLSAPIENIKVVKHGIRFAGSVVTAGLAYATKSSNKNKGFEQDFFSKLSSWVPRLFVNPSDFVCAEYAGYFEHRKLMEKIGVGNIGRVATQHSLGGMVMNAMGVAKDAGETEPLHLIPSANLTVNRTRTKTFKDAHGLQQWWRQDLNLQSTTYKYQ